MRVRFRAGSEGTSFRGLESNGKLSLVLVLQTAHPTLSEPTNSPAALQEYKSRPPNSPTVALLGEATQSVQFAWTAKSCAGILQGLSSFWMMADRKVLSNVGSRPVRGVVPCVSMSAMERFCRAPRPSGCGRLEPVRKLALSTLYSWSVPLSAILVAAGRYLSVKAGHAPTDYE